MGTIRQPAVAGQFYPLDPLRLQTMVTDYLQQAATDDPLAEDLFVPRAIIAPHAGYLYSGPIAASAYARLASRRETVTRVLALGPAHRVPVRGLAVTTSTTFVTPLGEIPVDQKAIQRLLAFPYVYAADRAHVPEHSLEVHLPFLQLTLDHFSLVPLLVGEATPQEVAGVLDLYATDEETLIVISSDLSHYHSYEEACRLDQETSRAIEALRFLAARQACGAAAVNGLLYLARQKGWEARTVDLRNSGDTAGPRHQVVGYGAYLVG